MYPNLKRLQSVFLDAIHAPTKAGRTAILDSECRGDNELRRCVSDLLNSHDIQELALDTPVFGSFATLPIADDDTGEPADEVASGTVIAGRYHLLDRLGQGGMGAVFRAEQFYPLRRTVAVKLIKPGLDSKTMLARFESERQALAKMDHSSIAKIYDAGVIGYEPEAQAKQIIPFACASGSRPFFVMELVDGIPISQFCAREQLTIRQRIELFIPVCQAIEHAHQKGVIHRDLKPANILVTQRDGRPVPVVIDFGIAKCIEARIDQATHHTGWGLFLGTLDYMAPEQAVGHSMRVDTRTDVYALGAMLYELLCGCVPLDHELIGDSVFDLVRALQEQEPVPPSVRAGRQSTAAATVSTAVPVQAPELRGELDWIVMKCLEKDSDRRYPSARAFADDLSHYLANEPVSAGPPTASYRLRKFMCRHWGSVIAAGIVMAALIGGIAGTTWGMVQARREKANVLAALVEKERARADEERQRVRADAKAAQAKFISDFIQFDVIRQANPIWQFNSGFTPDGSLTVRTALDRAAATIESRFGDKPLVVAVLHNTVGIAYDGLGEYATAIHHLQRAFGLYEQACGPEDERTMSVRQALGRSLANSQRIPEAIPLFERNLALLRATVGPDHDKTLTTETDLGNAFRDLGRFDEAAELLTHVYETARTHAPNSMGGMRTLINLAGLDECRGRFEEAIRKIESLKDHLLPGQEIDPMTKFVTTTGLGRFYLHVNRQDEGVRLLESSRDCARSMFGEEHFQFLNTITVLTDAYLVTGRTDDARQLLEQTRNNLRAKLGMNDIRVHRFSLELAKVVTDTGDIKRAEELVRETENCLAKTSSPDAIARALALATRGHCHYLTNRAAGAEPLVREALEILAARQKDDAQTHQTRVLLGLILVAQDRFAEAEPELIRGYEGLKRLDHRLLHMARRRMPEAAEALAKCAAARTRVENGP